MKHRTGMLLKKGAGYYCRWVVNGKVFVRALRDDAGRTITKIEGAEAARVKLMATYRVAEEAEALQSVAAQLDGKRAELAQINEERNPPLMIRQFWITYTAAQNRRDSGPRTLADYAGYWNRFRRWMEKEHPAAVAMRDVTEDMAEDYAADVVQAGLSVGSFNKHRDFLKLGYDVLAKKAKTTINPWNGIQRKKPSSVSRRELTVEELRRVCESATGEMRLLFATGLYTGLRLGDCATLRWGEVDLVRGIIRRVPNKTARSSNSKPVNVPLHPALRGMLAAIPTEDRRDYVLPNTVALYLRNAPELSGKIQAHFQSSGVRTTQPGTGVETVTGTDGKPEERHTGKRAVVEVGFHSLRHSFVSLCRESNAPLSVVESIVGHSNPAMTRHYTHTSEAAAISAVAALPSLMGTPPPAALPAADPVAVLKATVRALAESMTAKTWKEARTELLALATKE